MNIEEFPLESMWHQVIINETLKGPDFCFAYLDDIIFYSKTKEQHLDHIRHVFDQLWTAYIKLSLNKCDFFKSQIHYFRDLLS